MLHHTKSAGVQKMMATALNEGNHCNTIYCKHAELMNCRKLNNFTGEYDVEIMKWFLKKVITRKPRDNTKRSGL